MTPVSMRVPCRTLSLQVTGIMTASFADQQLNGYIDAKEGGQNCQESGPNAGKPFLHLSSSRHLERANGICLLPLVCSTPARSKISNRRWLLNSQILLPDNLSVRSISSHVNLEFTPSRHGNPIQRLGSRNSLLRGSKIHKAVMMVPGQTGSRLVG
jgi:hypothetical protein